MSPATSDDEVYLEPLNCYTPTQPNSAVPISYTDLLASHGVRGNIYDTQKIYTDENNMPYSGNFLLLKVHRSNNKIYSYASKALTDVEDDAEVKVKFLRAVKSASKFKPVEKDIAYVDFDDVINILP